MIALLLTFIWISQGIPAPLSQTGTVTGTLKTDNGTPAVGVRVGAMVRPESPTELSSASALSSIAETDAAGHFRLENVPQGRYYITAGRVDFPTFYPGTQDITAGRIVLVKPGDVITGIDFAMNSIAARPADTFSFGAAGSASFTVPIHIFVDGGGPTPVFSPSGFSTLRLTRISDGSITEIPLSATSIAMALPSAGTAPDYRLAINNLPAGYSVGSITNNIIKATMAGTDRTVTLGFAPNSNSGGTLTIMLLQSSISQQASGGVRVTGRAPNPEVRSIYLSGVPGIFFADGTFEFRSVKPGRYTVSTPDNPSSSRPLAAAIAVGDQDVTGIELTATPLLPLNIKTPVAPDPIGNYSPGSTIPLSAVSGLVLDEMTHEPITEGTVYLTGHYGGSRSLVPDGRFEFTRLLPGGYQLEVQTFGHNTIRKIIVVGEDDVHLDITAKETE
jgi:hypothetical protein